MAGETTTPNKSEAPTKTPSELMASAKVRVSGAAADVINAAKSYGKPDGKRGVGHYVGKAEDYLHRLHSPSDQGGQKNKPESVDVVAAAEGAEHKAADSVVVAAEGGEKKAHESAAVETAEKKPESTATSAGVGGLTNHSPSDQGGQNNKPESVDVVAAAEGAEPKAVDSVDVAAEGGEKKAHESAAVETSEKKPESTATSAGVGGLINKAKGLFK